MKVVLFVLCCIAPLTVLGNAVDPPVNSIEAISYALDSNTTEDQVKCLKDTMKKTIDLNPHLDAWYKHAFEVAKTFMDGSGECEKLVPFEQMDCASNLANSFRKKLSDKPMPEFIPILSDDLETELRSMKDSFTEAGMDEDVVKKQDEFKGKIATQMPELTPCFEYFFETGKRIVSLINTCDLEETLERKIKCIMDKINITTRESYRAVLFKFI